MSIWIIRHGQSQSNAGVATIGPHENALTELGYRQSQCIPTAIKQSPDLIVTSPYLRTQLTAKPLIEKFPHTAVDVWQVQEFTYLSLQFDRPTTLRDRKPLSKAYWDRCDPEYVDGTNAESLVQLMERVRTTLNQLQQQSGFVVVFSHGFFIKAMLWQILANPTVIDAVAMGRLLGFTRGFRVPNASILQMEFDSGGIPHWSSFITNHLPPELESATPDATVAINADDRPS
ncbi:histidine phosphatase family protein [Kamptonema animale CS-326]|uniref:histidine phosphatase family protein n=1 Tax=Kamptonema animale TaxID=92934 RepID=UPI00232F76EF|nr:histidine phosphatase family protein [Kamptonema animale]MDB9510723.1 histidine phosphatase family protein [Kamptonema animale CS-326]